MKRIIIMALVLVLALSLCACGSDNGSADMEITKKNTSDNVSTDADLQTESDEAYADEGTYCFTADGVKLIPGESFDSSKLPEAESVFTVPSCAIEGTDNVYSYGTFEVTAYDEGSGERIYSVYIFDANISTDEGLSVGDGKDKVIEIYGDDYEDNNGEFTYKKGDTLLVIVFQNDMVLSIDFRLDV